MSKYGEPWAAGANNTGMTYDRRGNEVAGFIMTSQQERAVHCVNALAGVPDDALPTLIPQAREVLESSIVTMKLAKCFCYGGFKCTTCGTIEAAKALLSILPLPAPSTEAE